ncbi:MAG: type II secretion system secretin GspD, partial [Phycisphaerae bacterium]
TPASRPVTTRPSAAVLPATQPTAATRPTTMPAEKGLLMNFSNASLQAVLEYLSEAAGLVILNGADAAGRVTIMSRKRVDAQEAVALLDTILKEKGYTAIQTGRLLKIVTLAQAAKENLPVHSGSDPSDVPLSDKLVTQVIPIRYAEATRLRTDLTPLIGTGATLTANDASNSLILIDTQTNIRRIMQIIRALDAHMAGVAEVKVYRLKFADAATTSRLITELFRQDQNQQETQRVFTPFGSFGGRGGPGGRSDRDRGRDDQGGARQQKVTATADERTNTLVVSAPTELLQVVDGVIKELDSDPTEEQSVFIYPLRNADSKNLETVMNQIFSDTLTTTGGRTASGVGTTSSRFGGQSSIFGRGSTPSGTTAAAAGDLSGQVYVVADEYTNSLLVRTLAKHVERVKQILAELDRPIRQVLIKVLIAEVTHDDTTDLGAEFSALNIRVGSSSSSIGTDFTVASQTKGLITKVIDADYTVTLRALATVGKLDVLSRPYILASDNQEASITVGQEVPFIRNTRTTETGQTINTIEYEDIGIILNVTPHINPEGLVIMDVAPEISTMLRDTTVQISEEVAAQVYAKRSAQTRVAIRNGQTIVIGGLMENRLTDTIDKVPILGDIPHLGALFRRTIKKKVKTELLIFITPHVADRPEQLHKMSGEETAGSKEIQGATGSGVFEEHMKGMQRGATTQPVAPVLELQPTKATSQPAGEKNAAPT